ncbi:hypothetical protein MMC25_004054 [Agyrium rufum]|nr:hypothetical protein [Agyrium rufum]
MWEIPDPGNGIDFSRSPVHWTDPSLRGIRVLVGQNQQPFYAKAKILMHSAVLTTLCEHDYQHGNTGEIQLPRTTRLDYTWLVWMLEAADADNAGFADELLRKAKGNALWKVARKATTLIVLCENFKVSKCKDWIITPLSKHEFAKEPLTFFTMCAEICSQVTSSRSFSLDLKFQTLFEEVVAKMVQSQLVFDDDEILDKIVLSACLAKAFIECRNAEVDRQALLREAAEREVRRLHGANVERGERVIPSWTAGPGTGHNAGNAIDVDNGEDQEVMAE